MSEKLRKTKLFGQIVAEGVGFEPTRRCRLPDFEEFGPALILMLDMISSALQFLAFHIRNCRQKPRPVDIKGLAAF